jgi:hypothetical protein
MHRRFQLVNVFASTPLSGNPLAAVGRRVWGEVLKQTPVKIPRVTRRG